MKNAKLILAAICEENGITLTYSEAKEYLIVLDVPMADRDFEIDGMEFRIIHNDDIWDIFVEEIKDIVNDCYDLKLDDVPGFIALTIDWEQTAENAFVDGYGHTFSLHDGSELYIGEYIIFRIN